MLESGLLGTMVHFMDRKRQASRKTFLNDLS